MKKTLLDWLTKKGKETTDLNNDPEFPSFVRSLFPNKSDNEISLAITQCSAALPRDDYENFSGCLTLALSK